MKEATGEVSMTVITIILVGIVLAIGTFLFRKDGPGYKWIVNAFDEKTGGFNDSGAIDGILKK